MRWMAVDHGTRRIGIAFCDETETIVTPFAVWPNVGASTVARLAALARAEEAGAIVVGLPRHDDGNESGTAPLARALAEDLDRALEAGPAAQLAGADRVRVILHGEGHTSREADRRVAEAGGASRAGRDAVAAAILLEDLLSTRRARGADCEDAPPAGE
jgi:putative Holliday junction resolvase